MNNLLTKICNHIRHFLVNEPEPVLLSNTLTDQSVWEEASVVSSSVSASVEDTESLPNDKERDYIYNAFKELSPEYLLIVAEMRNLLNSDTKKIIFHALATGLSIDEVASHLGLTTQQINELFHSAILDIKIQSGFVREYLENRIEKDMENEKLKSEIRSLEKHIINKASQQSTKSKLSVSKQKLLLRKPFTECLNLQRRTVNILRDLQIKTLEDLLIFISINGIEALKKQRNFGDSSLTKLEHELQQKGIFRKDGYCELYKYIAPPDSVKTNIKPSYS